MTAAGFEPTTSTLLTQLPEPCMLNPEFALCHCPVYIRHNTNRAAPNILDISSPLATIPQSISGKVVPEHMWCEPCFVEGTLCHRLGFSPIIVAQIWLIKILLQSTY